MNMQTLYKIDSKGRKRFYFLEIHEDGKFRSHTGIEGGKEMISEWTTCEAKNVGRANATTPHEQAIAEAKSKYDSKRDRDWADTAEDPKTRAFKPMLANGFPADPDDEEERAKWYKKYLKDEDEVIIQPKFDGLRCIIRKEGVFARSGKPFHTSAHLYEAVKHIFTSHPNLVIDGELYNHEVMLAAEKIELETDKEFDALMAKLPPEMQSTPVGFNKIISLAKKSKPEQADLDEAAEILQIHVYDFFDGDAPELSFYDRFHRYFPLIQDIGHPIVVVDTTVVHKNYDKLMAKLDGALEDGYEGIMVRFQKSPYEQKRSRSLWKVKKCYDEEYEVVDIVEGKGNWTGKAKRVTFKVGDTTAGAGITGTMEYCADLLANKEKYIGQPVTIKYQELTPDGIPRFGVTKHFYGEKRDT